MKVPIENPTSAPLIANLNTENYKHAAKSFLAWNRIKPSLPSQLDSGILADILRAFIRIPYENLSKIIKYQKNHHDTRMLRLPDEVWEDFREYALGGTCFSLTFFLKAIVDYLGFSSYPVMARMKSGPNKHCALVVDFQGSHLLLDPGYVLDVPMRINSEQRRIYRSKHTGVELRDGRTFLHYDLHTFTQEKSQWRYEFVDLPVSDADFLQHWLDSFSWNGMNGLCLTQARKDSLIFIHKYFMRETTTSGKHNFNLKHNREQMIKEIFGIPANIVEAAEAAVQERMA